MPPAVVTVTSTVPVRWVGSMAVICVGDTTEKLLAGTPPKDTAVAPKRFVPLMVTLLPPLLVPLLGLSDVTVGG